LHTPQAGGFAILRLMTLTIQLAQLLKRLSDRLEREQWLRDRGILLFPRPVPPVVTPTHRDEDEKF
jgi:hypothetical protein